mmetsp:Transcript_14529/g.22553  ORF Transcript_14529/g.22553 Transcript_14529/m.22553 type:complete len:80 (+) Transcript_14529:808-1047(+)
MTTEKIVDNVVNKVDTSTIDKYFQSSQRGDVSARAEEAMDIRAQCLTNRSERVSPTNLPDDISKRMNSKMSTARLQEDS